MFQNSETSYNVHILHSSDSQCDSKLSNQLKVLHSRISAILQWAGSSISIEVVQGVTNNTGKCSPGEVGEEEQVGPGSVADRVEHDHGYKYPHQQQHYYYERLKNKMVVLDIIISRVVLYRSFSFKATSPEIISMKLSISAWLIIIWSTYCPKIICETVN